MARMGGWRRKRILEEKEVDFFTFYYFINWVYYHSNNNLLENITTHWRSCCGTTGIGSILRVLGHRFNAQPSTMGQGFGIAIAVA